MTTSAPGTALGWLALIAMLGFGSSAASAAPTIASAKLTAVPIPGFPGTGNISGAGTALRGETTILGSEYDGSPPPITTLRFYAPAGTELHTSGFATCAPSVLEQRGPESCPRLSVAGPKGSALGSVTFGGERVPETASIQPFFAPGGGLEAFIDGTTPALFEVLAQAHVIGSAPPFGPEIVGEVPLIATVPEAPYASVERGTIEIGAAFRHGARTISYITMPKRCPSGGFPVKEEIGFLGGAIAQSSYTMPCPRR